MNELNNFVVLKNKQTNDKQPSHRVTYKEGDKWVDFAVCWTKKNKNGETYLFCQKSRPAPNRAEGEVSVSEIGF